MSGRRAIVKIKPNHIPQHDKYIVPTLLMWDKGKKKKNYGYPYLGGRYNSSEGRYNSAEVHTQSPKKFVQITYTTNAHNEYSYTPPKRIIYTPPVDGPSIYFPVYQSPLPGYVYEIKDLGSKYGSSPV